MEKHDMIIKKLSDEQHSDGSFGRFHSMNSKLRQKIPTTQSAVWIMYDYSLARDNEVCNKTCLYMEHLLNDLSLWPDAWEKNKWFKPAVPLYIASSLALFGSEDKRYKEVCDIWIDILSSAFEATKYSTDKINMKSKKLLGVEIDGSYIGIHGLNNLALYASNTDNISFDIQRLYMRWLYNYNGVITYTNMIPRNLSKRSDSAKIVSLLSRFNGFTEEFPNFAV